MQFKPVQPKWWEILLLAIAKTAKKYVEDNMEELILENSIRQKREELYRLEQEEAKQRRLNYLRRTNIEIGNRIAKKKKLLTPGQIPG